MMKSAIEINNISYAYRSDWTLERRLTLKDVSLTIEQGEAFGFLGHNGAGKTTTIKCILNLIKPSSGTIFISGIPTTQSKARASLGFLPEQPYFYDYLSVRELLQFYAKLAGIDANRRQARVAAVLEETGMASRAEDGMHTLSKGLTQRVALAQALLAEPKLLILDEPFSGLDPTGRREFRQIISRLHTQGTTIFMSSHVLADVEALCDRASIMAAGEIRGVYDLKSLPVDGTSYELSCIPGALDISTIKALASTSQHSGQALKLKFSSRDSAERALADAVTKGVEIRSFEAIGTTLEEIFIQVINTSHEGI